MKGMEICLKNCILLLMQLLKNRMGINCSFWLHYKMQTVFAIFYIKHVSLMQMMSTLHGYFNTKHIEINCSMLSK